MNFENLPRRVKRRASGYLFGLLKQATITFASPPMIEGYWPKIANAGTMTFGNRCIFSSARMRHLISAGKNAVLEIGHHAFLNDGVNICATQSITIGNFVKIADMVSIFDSDFHPVAPDQPVRQKPVIIGDNVWIGANSIILAGVRIGNHAVIAANSVVNTDVPAKSVVAGTPARLVKTFDAPDGWVRGG